MEADLPKLEMTHSEKYIKTITIHFCVPRRNAYNQVWRNGQQMDDDLFNQQGLIGKKDVVSVIKIAV